MKLVNANPFHITVRKGEQITVDVQAIGTDHSVVYGLDGQAGNLSQSQPLLFSLIHKRTLLHLSFSFTNPQGGAYQIRVTGDVEGNLSEYTLKQAPNLGMFASLTYIFDLGGDETKGDYD